MENKDKITPPPQDLLQVLNEYLAIASKQDVMNLLSKHGYITTRETDKILPSINETYDKLGIDYSNEMSRQVGKSLEECINIIRAKYNLTYAQLGWDANNIYAKEILKLYESQRQPEWISASQQLPDNSDEVLVLAPNCYIIGQSLIGKYFAPEGNHNASWTVYDFGQSNLHEFVTHWMPLPNPPKER